MVVQINSCSGEYSIKFSSKIINSQDDKIEFIPYHFLSRKYGRRIYILDNLKSKHIYLSIKSKQNEIECNSGLSQDSNGVFCSKELSYLLHYYSTTEKKYDTIEQLLKFEVHIGEKEGQIVLVLPRLREFDYHNNIIDKNYVEYNLFWTYNQNYSKYIESICYLGHLMQNNEKSEINFIKNIQLNEKNEYIIDNIEYDKIIYINILNRNLKSNELILYKPIKAKMIMPSSFRKFLPYILALIFLCLIIYISFKYYQKEKNNLSGYKLANTYENQKDDIKYTNINSF